MAVAQSRKIEKIDVNFRLSRDMLQAVQRKAAQEGGGRNTIAYMAFKHFLRPEKKLLSMVTCINAAWLYQQKIKVNQAGQVLFIVTKKHCRNLYPVSL